MAGSGIPKTKAVAATRVLLLLNDGGGRGCAGRHLVVIRADGFFLCVHGAATRASLTHGTVVGTGGVVRRGVVEARAVVLPAVPGWINSPLCELA